jgi:hypothetical protein
MRRMKQWTLGLVASLGIDVSQAFDAPSDVPTWCGKPYMSSWVEKLLSETMLILNIEITPSILEDNSNSPLLRKIHCCT